MASKDIGIIYNIEYDGKNKLSVKITNFVNNTKIK